MGDPSHNLALAELDARDRAILRVLMTDGRISNADLAARVNLSASACLRRVKLLEDAGFIAGFAMLPDATKLDLTGVAFISVSLEKQGRAALDAFEKAVARHPEIVECYLLAGAADYLLRVVFRDTAHLERLHTDVLTQLPGVARLQSTLSLRTVKKTTALPLPR